MTRHLASGAALVLLAACSGGVAPPQSAPRPIVDSAFLLDPLAGYDGSLPESSAARLRSAHRRLLVEAATADAIGEAEALLALQPGLAPAVVLKAQGLLASGDAGAAFTAVESIAAADRSYDAAQLVAARAAEQTGRLVAAFVSYSAVAPRSAMAAERFAALRPRAMEIVSNRMEQELARDRVDEAQKHLAVLERWAPEAERTLAGSAEIAARVGDRRAELEAVRKLSGLRVDDVDLRVRRARLELEVGDPGSALRLLQRLANERPDDAGIASELARARFIWRLELLPPKVTALGREPELDRAEMAVLLYWLFPSVRYGTAESGTIANDVLDHPHRQEIVRVANLGIMDVDPRLHRFNPDRLVDRRSALRSVLRALARHDPTPSCLAGGRSDRRLGGAETCELAMLCGVLTSADDCRAGVTASGADVLEWTRRALDRLGRE